jgi:hypothetical protein
VEAPAIFKKHGTMNRKMMKTNIGYELTGSTRTNGSWQEKQLGAAKCCHNRNFSTWWGNSLQPIFKTHKFCYHEAHNKGELAAPPWHLISLYEVLL